MMKKGNTIYLVVLIIFVSLSVQLVHYFTNDSITNSVTVVTAIIGATAIWYQLKKDHDISKAEFIITLNNTFHENENIKHIYNKLKEFRDLENVTFTANDGRLMGDYIMYFEIMNYLVDENIVTIKMIDKLFANKFFIFVNNPFTQEYQLKFSAINIPILELYCKWYNYRTKNKLPSLYPKYSTHIQMEKYFILNKHAQISLNYDQIVNY